MTSGGDLCHVGTSKLISDTNQWTGPCVIEFLPEGRSETMIHHQCGSGKYTTVLCFGIGGGDARALHHFTLGVWRVSGAFSDVLSHYGIVVCFSLWYKWDYVTSIKYIYIYIYICCMLHLKLSLYCPVLGVGASFPFQGIWLSVVSLIQQCISKMRFRKLLKTCWIQSDSCILLTIKEIPSKMICWIADLFGFEENQVVFDIKM